METKPNKHYAMYVRVSTDEQARAKEGSLRSQEQRLRDFLNLKEVDSKIVVYREEGKSAKDTNRPEYQTLLERIKKGKIGAIVFTEISRISRSTIDFLNFADLCNQNNVDLICLKQPIDTTTAMGRAFMTFCSLMSQLERELVSERTSANLRARAKRGLHNGGYAYGYRPDPQKKGYLIIDEHEAIVVNLMYDKYLEIGSYCKTATWLNEQGYRTREYTSRQGKLHSAKAWSDSSVQQLLQNPRYIGKSRAGDEVVEAVWEPTVDLETWEKVQELMKQNYKIRGNTKRSNKKHTYLLGGLVYCTHCEIFLESGSGTGGSNGSYFYYRHKKKSQKKDCPHPTSIPVRELESIVSRQILHLLEDEELVDLISDEVMEKVNKEIVSVKEQISLFDSQMLDMDKESGGLVKKIIALDEEQIREFISPKLSEISERKQALANKKGELELELEELQDQAISPDDIRYTVSCLANSFDALKPRQKQRIMRILVEKVELYPKKVKVFLRVAKKSPQEPSDRKFEEIPSWLPR